MNERILELAEQATSIVEMVGPQGYTSSYAKFDREKFAELIVRECAKICNDVGVAVFAEQVQNNFGTAQTCKVAIEKHFGVEE